LSHILPFRGIIPQANLASSIVNGLEFSSFTDICLNFDQNLKNGRLILTQSPSFFIYEVQDLDHSYTGIWTSTDSKDLQNGIIRKHEKIYPSRSQNILDMFTKNQIDFNPILITYPNRKSIDSFILKTKSRKAFIEVWEDFNQKLTRLWIIEESEEIDFLIREFKDLDSVYLADGHHRAYAFQQWVSQEPKRDPSQKLPGFSSIYFSLDQVSIRAYHRLITLYHPKDYPQIFEKIKTLFEVIPVREIGLPHSKGEFFLMDFLNGLYILRLKSLSSNDLIQRKDLNDFTHIPASLMVENLDVSVLQKYLFQECMGIGTKNELGKLEYAGGKDAEKLITGQVLSEKAHMGIFLFPPNFDEIKTISNAGLFMPQKSTYFEPKIPSGLIIQDLS